MQLMAEWMGRQGVLGLGIGDGVFCGASGGCRCGRRCDGGAELGEVGVGATVDDLLLDGAVEALESRAMAVIHVLHVDDRLGRCDAQAIASLVRRGRAMKPDRHNASETNLPTGHKRHSVQCGICRAR